MYIILLILNLSEIMLIHQIFAVKKDVNKSVYRENKIPSEGISESNISQVIPGKNSKN